jgi:hypothetical protein
MSRTACSGSAVLSTIMALSPPVSAISGASGARFAAMARWIALRRRGRAGEGDAVDPRVRGQRGADHAPSPGRSCSAVGGHAGLVQQRRRAPGGDGGVCSAGLASTALPAASAAAIWPVKMASGKFQG